MLASGLALWSPSAMMSDTKCVCYHTWYICSQNSWDFFEFQQTALDSTSLVALGLERRWSNLALRLALFLMVSHQSWGMRPHFILPSKANDRGLFSLPSYFTRAHEGSPSLNDRRAPCKAMLMYFFIWRDRWACLRDQVVVWFFLWPPAIAGFLLLILGDQRLSSSQVWNSSSLNSPKYVTIEVPSSKCAILYP